MTQTYTHGVRVHAYGDRIMSICLASQQAADDFRAHAFTHVTDGITTEEYDAAVRRPMRLDAAKARLDRYITS